MLGECARDIYKRDITYAHITRIKCARRDREREEEIKFNTFLYMRARETSNYVVRCFINKGAEKNKAHIWGHNIKTRVSSR